MFLLQIPILSIVVGSVLSCSPNLFGSPVGSTAVGPPGYPGVPGLPGLITMPTPNVTNRERRDVEKNRLNPDSFMHIVFDSEDIFTVKKCLNKIGKEMTQKFFADPEMLSFVKFNFMDHPVIVFAEGEIKSIFQLPKMSMIECLALQKRFYEITKNPEIRSIDVVCN